MKHYFALQYNITMRRLSDAGLQPLLGCILIAVAFILLTFYLYSQTTYAPYLYVLLAALVISKLSAPKRNEFLKIIFGDSTLIKVRLLENLLVAFPFYLFLLYHHNYIACAVLVVLTISFVFITFNYSLHITVRTPFYKSPFEFTIGFRNTFYLIIEVYIVTYFAVVSHNFNLGIFCLLFSFAVQLGYYLKPENEYYVWMHSLTSQQFILNKFKIAFVYSAYIVSPIIVCLSIFFTQHLALLLLFYVVGLGYLAFIIVLKYAVYPNEINVVQGLLFAISISFPPLLIFFIPYFFLQSKKNIAKLLK